MVRELPWAELAWNYSGLETGQRVTFGRKVRNYGIVLILVSAAVVLCDDPVPDPT